MTADQLKSDSNYGIDFIFEKEHKYFKTKYICEYVPGSVRVFEDFGTTHTHDNLLKNESFKKLIKYTENKTEFTFKECDGGYGSQLDDNGFDFIFNDKIRVTVRFDMGDGKTAVYDIDLDNMDLSEEYRIYQCGVRATEKYCPNCRKTTHDEDAKY